MVTARGASADGSRSESGEDLSTLFDQIEGDTPDTPTVRRLAQTDPDDMSVDNWEAAVVLDELDDLLADDRIAVHRLAAAAGVRVARASPETADRWFARLRSLLDDDATERRGLAAMERLARERPEIVAPRVETILTHLDSPRTDVRRCAAGIARAIAEARPAALVGSVPAVVTALAADEAVTGSTDTDPRSEPFEAGGELSGNRADDRQFLERNRQMERVVTRATLARTLAAVTRAVPDESAKRVVEAGATNALLELLDDEQPLVRAAAVGLAGSLAESHPEAVGAAIPSLVGLLRDDTETVRGGAVWALVALGRERALAIHDPATLEALEHVARTDENDHLRELAAWALEELESIESEEP